MVNYEVSFTICVSDNVLSEFNAQFLCKRLMTIINGIETRVAELFVIQFTVVLGSMVGLFIFPFS